ncbi:MAG TPA: SMP-30/gluconolactonase/LRE family protein [Candidatus Saccharimonadales bacterium]|nr:SMP-30/gluconolactonase/LRE family protein [Candidatus Saccharimonadales bacterium]
MNRTFLLSILAAQFLSLHSVTAQNLGGDMALSLVLMDNEGWQKVAEGYQFTDAACGDAEGNFYFTDVAKGTTINRITPDGKVGVFLENMPRISGLKFGPDHRLYACVQGPQKSVIAIELPSAKIDVLATKVEANDLAVSPKKNVYFTDTSKGQVILIAPGGAPRVAASGINKPNGIILSPDSGTLAVSEYGGTNVWAYRVDADGSLSAGAKYMELRSPIGKSDSQGDGMTVDTMGRYYVTSALGIQMFDSTGRMGGVIARPQNKGAVSAAFGGPNLEYLYVCSTDKVFRRKTKAKGVWLFGEGQK